MNRALKPASLQDDTLPLRSRMQYEAFRSYDLLPTASLSDSQMIDNSKLRFSDTSELY